jgi:hypothetical protein
MCITNVSLSMSEHTLNAQPDIRPQTYQYDDGWVVVAAVDPRVGELQIDTVDDTAICVSTADNRAVHLELPLPGPATTASYHNGVITVEGH